MYLGSYPAEICNRIDWSSLRPEPASFIDARLDDDHTDLLYTARLHSLAEIVYLLVEHQSTNDPDMPLRMHTYLDRIYEHQRNQKVKPLAHVLPLIVTHALGGWTAPRRFCELFAPAADDDADLSRLTPQFDVTILDVRHMTNQDIDAFDLADFGKLVLWLLRDGRTWPLLWENMQYWVPTLRRARLARSYKSRFPKRRKST
jgi:predicted transposase YdaD